MNSLCSECTKRDLCAVLCPEAELYAGQDHIGRRDIPKGKIYPRPWPAMIEKTYLTKRENQILTLLGHNLDRADICKVLNINRHTLRTHIYNMRRKIDDTNVR